MSAMEKEYGKDAKHVFYASRNKGTITGVDPESSGKKKKRPKEGQGYSGVGR